MKITNMDHFEEVVSFARSCGPEMFASLSEQIIKLVRWENSQRYKDSYVILRPDFEKCSFYFDWRYPNGERIMNGGIIFHGLPDGADLAQYSVTLDRQYGWTMHT